MKKPSLTSSIRIFIFCIAFSLVGTCSLLAQTLTSDQSDYVPGSTVILTGSGFSGDETVTMQVVHVDGDGDNDSSAHQPWDITADGDGNFTTTWLVPADQDEAGASLKATANGQSGAYAETFFTDASNGTGVVTLTANGGSCLGFTPAVGNGPDNWEVAQGSSYTMTITGVTECSGDAITVFVQNSNVGNFCFNAVNTGPGTYVGTFDMPNPACNTSPISYKCGGDGPCSNANTFNAKGPSLTNSVHLRASTFDANCNKTGDDTNCSAASCTLNVTGDQTDVTCHGTADGSITLTVSGAVGTVTYLWNDGATTKDRTGLSGGAYSVTVTDDGVSGCSKTAGFTIKEPDSLGVTGTVIDVTITNGSDGSIDITVTGGTSPYLYLWNDGATTDDRTGLTAGTYSVTVTDDHGCTAGASFTVHQPGCSLSIEGQPVNLTCKGSANGSITLTVSGAQGNVTYLWNDGVTTQNRTGLAAGTYSVTATDEGGCTATGSFKLTQPKALSLTETHVNVSSSGGHDGSITLTVTGGTKPYTYLWSNGKTTKNIKGLTAGTYSVVVTDAHGCTAGLSVTITETTCACVVPTNITFSTVSTYKVQMCWNSVPCALGYYIKWKLSTKKPYQYRTVNAPDTCTIFTFATGQSDLIYIATICANGDTTAFSQLYTYPPQSRNANDVKPASEFSVFPNPTSGNVMIVLKNEELADQQVTIQVMNVFGQLMQTERADLVNGNLTKSFELKDGLAAGMYMVNVTIGSKMWHQQIIYSKK